MALMNLNLADLIAKCLCMGRIHRYVHSSLRFLAKNSGFAAALGQKKCLEAGRRLAAGRMGPRFHWQKVVPAGAPTSV
jgi:hypothetical protein